MLLVTYKDHQGGASHYGDSNKPASLHLTDYNTCIQSQQNNQCIHAQYKVLISSKFVCNVMQRIGFTHMFICMNDQGLSNLYGSVVFHIQC